MTALIGQSMTMRNPYGGVAVVGLVLELCALVTINVLYIGLVRKTEHMESERSSQDR